MLSKLSFLKERALDNLLAAKKHSDNRQYKYKHEILALMMSKSPKDFYVDSDDGSIVGLTHAPTRFKIHVPKKFVPSKVEKKIMPSKSQNQQKLMNWVHAIQKGKATGPVKIKHIADSMKPDSVEHFMGRGHINKELPVKKAFELGFLKRAAELGVHPDKANTLFKLANGLPPGLGEAEPLIKTPFNPSGGNAPSQLPPGLGSAPTQGANPSFNVDVNKPLVNPSPPDPNANNSLNIPQGQPQQLPPSPLGIPQGPPPSQLPPAFGQKQLKSAPGTKEHADELYLEHGDDSELRTWTQAHPSQATMAARESSNAWNNLGNSVDGNTTNLNTVQQTGSALDQHLKGVNPMMYGATAANSTEGQNYNNAWEAYNKGNQNENELWGKALDSDKQYDNAFAKQREELRNLRGDPTPQLLGSKPYTPPNVPQHMARLQAAHDFHASQQSSNSMQPQLLGAQPVQQGNDPRSILAYRMDRGDTFESMATQFNTTPEKIREMNRLQGDAAVRPGEELLVPTSARPGPVRPPPFIGHPQASAEQFKYKAPSGILGARG